jgi:hypothetical protein
MGGHLNLAKTQNPAAGTDAPLGSTVVVGLV